MPQIDESGFIREEPDDEPREGFPRWAMVCLIGSLACSAATLAILVGLLLGARS